MIVRRLEQGDHTRAGRIHEAFAVARCRHAGLHGRNVGVQRGEVLDLDRADAAGAAVLRRAAGLGQLLKEAGIILQVSGRAARTVTFEAGEPILDVGRIGDLRGLAIGRQVDADRPLLRHDGGGGVAHDRIIGGFIKGHALLPAEQQVGHDLGPGQGAHMGGFDGHVRLPLR